MMDVTRLLLELDISVGMYTEKTFTWQYLYKAIFCVHKSEACKKSDTVI